jgi:hypothetical protein
MIQMGGANAGNFLAGLGGIAQFQPAFRREQVVAIGRWQLGSRSLDHQRTTIAKDGARHYDFS